MLFLKLKNKVIGQGITRDFLSIYRDPELQQSSALKNNRKDWTCCANSTFILQWNWEAKCCRVRVADNLSKIGIRTCGFISFYFLKKKIIQLGRIMYHSFFWACFFCFFVFFFSGKAYDLLWDRQWREKNIFKGRIFFFKIHLVNQKLRKTLHLSLAIERKCSL